jgi:hypothetical protein
MRPDSKGRPAATRPETIYITLAVGLGTVAVLFLAGWLVYNEAMSQLAEGDPNVEKKLVWRRLSEPFSPWAVFVPVLFAYAAVGLITLFRGEHRGRFLLVGTGVVTALAIPYCILCSVVFKLNALTLLAPFLAIGLFYVGLMYYQDARSIHPAWASFLGVCRCTVYATLAIVFLLPGCQSWEKTETHSRVLVLVDVSGSMHPPNGEQRLDQVVKLLTTNYGLEGEQKNFIEHLVRKSPVVCYRFGSTLDKKPVEFLAPGKAPMSPAEFLTWLKPTKENARPEPRDPKDKDAEDPETARLKAQARIVRLLESTDIAGPALEATQNELGANNLQAVIIFSDGNRNKGSDESVRELVARASTPKRPIHIVTVGVGEYRDPVRIRLLALRAPSEQRPDDPAFQVQVPVFGDGLLNQQVEVTLQARRVKDAEGNAIDPKLSPAIPIEKKTATFKVGEDTGGLPFARLVFDVDLKKITGIDPKNETESKTKLQGTWAFTAHIPRHPLESKSDKAEHVNDPPTNVVILDKKLRILLVSSGPSRDYQFMRNQFYREVEDKRMDLSIYLQTAADSELKDVNQDVEGQRLLTRFPDKFGKVEPEERYTNLKEYDVVVAMDVDWMKIMQETPQALELLKRWVGEGAGALVFVGGPIHTDKLARPGGADTQKLLRPLFTLMPVTLSDSLYQGIKGARPPDRSRPWILEFTAAASNLDFLKLDEKDRLPLSGWNKFFWGDAAPEPTKQPRRGFFSYHPVEKVAPGAEVLATFGDPEAPKVKHGERTVNMPYFVTMRYDKGRTFYVGSGELWRLKTFKNDFYERFTTKLVRYVSTGGQSAKVGRFIMGPEYPQGNIPVDAIVLTKDGDPLDAALQPEVVVIRPQGFDPKADTITPAKFRLKAQPGQGGQSRGIFTGTFQAETPGQYTLRLEAGGAEPFTHTFNVMPPNVELGNLKTDFEHLYMMASNAAPALERLEGEARKRVQEALTSSRGGYGKDIKEARLFFTLNMAKEAIPQLITKVPPDSNKNKGKYEELWDKGSDTGWRMRADFVMMLGIGCFGILAGAILFFISRPLLAANVLGVCGLFVLCIYLTNHLRFGHAVLLLLLGCAVLIGLSLFLTRKVIPGLVVVSCFVLAGLAYFVSAAAFGDAVMGYSGGWQVLRLEMAWVLGFVVTLLGVEWLTRKLLKLA